MKVDVTMPTRIEDVGLQVIGDADGLQINVEVDGQCRYRIALLSCESGDMVLQAVEHDTAKFLDKPMILRID